jgi:beta-lactamase class C
MQGPIAAFATVLLAVPLMSPPIAPNMDMDAAVERLVTRELAAILPPDRPGGAAVAIRQDGRTLFFNHGFADAANKRPVTSDSLFNLASLRKLFEATLLAQAAQQGTLSLADPVAKYVTELQQGGDIRRITIGELATHTSGLLLRPDYPPWPVPHYTPGSFFATLNAWMADDQHAPGKQHIYTHGGFVLLHLALDRALGTDLDALIRQELLAPLGMTSTVFPQPDESLTGQLASEYKARAVQGYAEDGKPIGEPGDQQGYYDWPGTGQVYASARDMAQFLAASLGELPVERSIAEAMKLAQRAAFRITPRNSQGLGWEIIHEGALDIVEKNGGLDNTSTYIGMIPARKLGIVILSNRGDQYPSEVGRCIMLALAHYSSEWHYQCAE